MDIAIHINRIRKEQMLKFKTKLKLYWIKKNKNLFSYSSVSGASLNG